MSPSPFPPIALLVVVAIAAQPPIRTLAAPDREFPRPFTEILGLRELSDGRVVVNDYRDRTIHVVDMQSGVSHQIGRDGSGPGEYRLPLNILALPGDSTAVYDMANGGKLQILMPDGKSAGLLNGMPATQGHAMILESSLSDRLGRIYSLLRPAPNGSDGIERFNRATGRREIVAYVSPYAVSPLLPPRAGGAGGRAGSATSAAVERPRGPLPFATHDQWTVAPDGRVAVVAAEPYRVTFTEANGTTKRQGPIIAVDPVRVSEAHKAKYREENQQKVAALVSLGSGRGMVSQFIDPGYQEPTTWPDFLPAFLSKAVSFAPNGILWVKRTTEADAPPTYDLIDASGRITAKVVLARGSRLVGFGANFVYVVRRDKDELEYLQRYRIP